MLTDGGSPTPFGNVAVLRRPLADAEWPEAARRMHAFYAEQDGGPFMTFSGWPTPDVRGLGFGAVGHPPLMLRPVGPIDSAGAERLHVAAGHRRGDRGNVRARAHHRLPGARARP